MPCLTTTLLDVDFLDVTRAFLQEDAVSAIRTPDATVLVEFDVALTPRTLVRHTQSSVSSVSAVRMERRTESPPGVVGR